MGDNFLCPWGKGSWQLQGSWLSLSFRSGTVLAGQSPEVVICGLEGVATVLGKLGPCTAFWAEVLRGTGGHDSPEVGVGGSGGS